MIRVFLCFLLMFICTTSVLAQEQSTTKTKAKSSISEHERRGIAEKELINWENELANVAKVVKAQLKFEEDKKLIDDYVSNCKSFAKATSTVDFLRFANLDMTPGKNRNYGTGAPASLMREEAKVYRQSTMYLIKIYKDLTSKDYEFVFVPKPEKKTAAKPVAKNTIKQ